MKRITINSENGKQLQERFSLLHFNDFVEEQKNDAIAAFAKQTGITEEEAEYELTCLNPSVIISTDYIANSGDETSSIINLF